MNENKRNNKNNRLMFILKIIVTAAAALSVGTTGFVIFNRNNSDKKNENSKVIVNSSAAESGSIKNKSVEQSSESKSGSNDTDNDTVITYTLADVDALQNVDYFANGTLEHIFDGTINKKGKATGYHYTMISDSKGEVIEGTKSKTDKNGVFTGKVKVSGISKNGFSSFYPESWSPQQVVDAINSAYEDAVSDPSNPSGSLWIGHYGDIEIDMYLNNSKKITTAYPVYEGD